MTESVTAVPEATGLAGGAGWPVIVGTQTFTVTAGLLEVQPLNS